MIALLKGILIVRTSSFVIVDVHGVGYKVYAESAVLTNSHIGDPLTLFIHTHVREDSLDLYGFLDQASLDLFELFIGVSGIGPKTAIGIFALGDKHAIVAALRNADVDFFTGVPRLGKKNAQKLIIELKNKIGMGEELNLAEETGETREVMDALIAFGFSEGEARKAFRMVADENATISQKVRLALKYLGR